jgi:hypothetical protein
MTTVRQETVDEGIDNAKAKGLRSTVFIVLRRSTCYSHLPKIQWTF